MWELKVNSHRTDRGDGDWAGVYGPLLGMAA